MVENFEWIWNRPLTEKDRCRISRKGEAEVIIKLLNSVSKGIFLWSPPKSGTTTFMLELMDECKNEGVAVASCNAISVLDNSTLIRKKEDEIPDIILIDETEDIRDVEDIDRLINIIEKYILSGSKLLITGDARVFSALNNYKPNLIDNNIFLSPFPTQDIANLLVINPFNTSGVKIDREAASLLCDETGKNAYLVQRLAPTLLNNLSGKDYSRSVKATIEPFLSGARHSVNNFFEDLVHRIINDDRAPYEILDLCAGRPSDMIALKGIGVVKSTENQFVSNFHKTILSEMCTAKKLANRFGGAGNYDKAISLYKDTLDQWQGAPEGRIDVLLQALKTAYAADNAPEYTYFSRPLSRILRRSVRIDWLKNTFVPEIIDLISKQEQDEPATVFSTVVKAVDTIARTNRIRLYLADAHRTKLICREVIGSHTEVFKKEPVIIAQKRWLISRVFIEGLFTEVKDNKEDPETNQEIVKKTDLLSSWIFPIFSPDSTVKQQDPDENRILGVLCIDNPLHTQDSPGNSEKKLIEEVLYETRTTINSRCEEANRLDLLSTLDLLTSLHQHLLTDQPTRDILSNLLIVAQKIQPNLSMIAVRLIQGIDKKRMSIVDNGYWPHEKLQKIFSKPEIRTISISDSIADPNRTDDFEVYEDLYDNKKPMSPVLKLFVDTVREENVSDFSIRSLISFKMYTRVGNNYEFLGMCNFYTSILYPFTDHEINSLRMIVRHAAAAIYNARQLRWTERQRDGLELLSNCIAYINEQTQQENIDMEEETKELIKIITQGLAKVFNVNGAFFCLVDANNTGGWKIVYTYNDRGATVKSEDFSLDEGVTGKSIETKKPKIVSRLDEEWGKLYIERMPGMNTCAAIPMIEDNKVTGVLTLETEIEDAFTIDDIELIKAVVQEIPVAMKNLRLVTNLVKANQRLENQRWTDAMGESVAQALHRVGNIVGGIPLLASQCLKLLNDLKEINPEIIGYLKNIRRDGIAMQSIASKLSNSQSDKIKLINVDICNVISESILNIKLPKNIKINWEKHLSAHVKTDANKVKEIISCVLENAIIATEHGLERRNEAEGFVTVDLICGSNKIIIEIIDQGNGVHHTQIADVCHTIVQSHFKGHGIGLFVSSLMSRRLGGDLCLKDSTETGSTFKLVLPIMPDRENSREE